MKLKEFLSLWTDNELIDIVYRSISSGAYTVKELLSNSEYLDKTVKCSELRVDKADDFIAEDSMYRDEFFQATRELPYICLELSE